MRAAQRVLASGAAVGCLVLTFGCAKSQKTSAAPGRADAASSENLAFGAAGADRAEEPDGSAATLDELEAEYAQVDAALNEAGVENTRALTPGVAPTSEPAGAGETSEKRVLSERERLTQCERICDLQVSICDLSERICALADSHAGEERYANACSGASARCEQAQGACETCGSD